MVLSHKAPRQLSAIADYAAARARVKHLPYVYITTCSVSKHPWSDFFDIATVLYHDFA